MEYWGVWIECAETDKHEYSGSYWNPDGKVWWCPSGEIAVVQAEEVRKASISQFFQTSAWTYTAKKFG